MKVLSTPFPVGSYIGTPDGSNASANTAFEANYTSFVATLGIAPQLLDTYVDYTQPVSNWVSDASWAAWSSAITANARDSTPVIGLPMYSTAAAALTPDQQYQAIAAGQDDSVLAGIVKSYTADGFLNLVFRPGWEMNLQGPTFAGSTTQDQADWVAAFQHIYVALHADAAADGATATVVWNPGATNYSTVSATTALYPGNSSVDAIGADVYSDIYPYNDGGSSTTYHDWATGGEDITVAQFVANPVNRAHYWSYPAANEWSLNASGGHSLSLADIIQFAEQQGKPLAIPETGAGDSNNGTDVQDDPVFPQWLSQQLTAAQASGEKIDFINIWDSNASGGNYEFSYGADGKPLEAASWATYFGNAGNAPVANPDSAALTATSQGVWIGAANNDTAAKGYTLSVTSVNTMGTKGTVTLNPAATNGMWYSPGTAFAYLSEGETASDSFTYTISDGHGGTATATDTVAITGVVSPPVAKPDSAITTATTSGVWIGAANNDTDAKGYVLSVRSVNATGTKGTVTLNPTATNGVYYSLGTAYAYLSQGETATDSFGYTISDGHGGTATATDTITITGVNQAPVAKNDAAATSASKAVAIGLLASASDVNRDDVLSVTGLTTTATKGSVTLGAGGVATYTPGAAFKYLAAGTTATDSFGYTVSDNHGATATATATVTITGASLALIASTALVSTSGIHADASNIAATAGSGSKLQFLTAATRTLALSEAVSPANSATSLPATVLDPSPSPSSGWSVEIDTTATLKAMTGGTLSHPSADAYLFTPASRAKSDQSGSYPAAVK